MLNQIAQLSDLIDQREVDPQVRIFRTDFRCDPWCHLVLQHRLGGWWLVSDARGSRRYGVGARGSANSRCNFVGGRRRHRRYRRLSCRGIRASIGRRAQHMIRFENVTKTYPNGTLALKNVSVEINKGDFVFLVGSSGSGKTS